MDGSEKKNYQNQIKQNNVPNAFGLEHEIFGTSGQFFKREYTSIFWNLFHVCLIEAYTCIGSALGKELYKSISQLKSYKPDIYTSFYK